MVHIKKNRNQLGFAVQKTSTLDVVGFPPTRRRHATGEGRYCGGRHLTDNSYTTETHVYKTNCQNYKKLWKKRPISTYRI